MAGWHHWLDGRESEWTSGVGDGQGGLVCCDSWGHKESVRTERLNWTDWTHLFILIYLLLWYLHLYVIFIACMHAIHAKSVQSCPTLCNPTDSSPPGSSVHRILEARILEWVAISFSSLFPKNIEFSFIKMYLLFTHEMYLKTCFFLFLLNLCPEA